MMLGILNFVLDTDEARSIVRQLMAAVPPGSCLVLTHPTTTAELGGTGNTEAMTFWNKNATPQIIARSRAEIMSFFDGLELLDPASSPAHAGAPDPDTGAARPRWPSSA